ncbi:MAG: adenosylcobinamide-phosphate synthase CbiB [Eubacteriales bacterium]|nr:adenosylcobinamide-phosphate synthase CbiB [Eubacteriales bacterium]
MKITLAAMILGFLLDLILGDPQGLYHPIRLVGNLIAFLDRHLFIGETGEERAEKDKRAQRFWGCVLVIVVLELTGLVSGLIVFAAGRIHPVLRLIVETIMCWQLLAAKCLKDESMKVQRALKTGNLERSRRAVSMIVGRDTQELDEEGIARAAVETVAENTSDGVIAPLFYVMIGGPVLGWIYKAVNTMDSMVGYKNDRYRYFGTCAARLDDIANFLPARLSGILMIAAAFLTRQDGKNAAKMFVRDRYNHASPNSAQTESAMAGALNVRLGGDAFYFGKRHRKKTIGDKNRAIEAEDIERANRVMYATAVLGLIVCVLIRLLVIALV